MSTINWDEDILIDIRQRADRTDVLLQEMENPFADIDVYDPFWETGVRQEDFPSPAKSFVESVFGTGNLPILHRILITVFGSLALLVILYLLGSRIKND